MINLIREWFGKWEIIHVHHYRDFSYHPNGVASTTLTLQHSITGRVKEKNLYGVWFIDKALAKNGN